jgi:hypothetical protein
MSERDDVLGMGLLIETRVASLNLWMTDEQRLAYGQRAAVS